MVLWAKGMFAGTESSTEVRHRLLAGWFLYYGLVCLQQKSFIRNRGCRRLEGHPGEIVGF